MAAWYMHEKKIKECYPKLVPAIDEMCGQLTVNLEADSDEGSSDTESIGGEEWAE